MAALIGGEGLSRPTAHGRADRQEADGGNQAEGRRIEFGSVQGEQSSGTFKWVGGGRKWAATKEKGDSHEEGEESWHRCSQNLVTKIIDHI